MSQGQKITEQQLMDLAREAKKNSYSPYSKFPVGAAVLLDDGQVFTGVNIENASYGLTCCAERVALFSARSASSARVAALAISIGPEGAELAPETLSPCGACRQVMAEFLAPETPVYVDRNRRFTMSELLPFGFVLPDGESR